MSYLPALLLPLAALLTPTLAADSYVSSNSETPKDNNGNCSCYVVSTGDNSDTPQYFQYYRFYDFRNLAGGFDTAPPLINDTQNASALSTWQPSIFNSDNWISDWGIQNWSKPATDDFPVPLTNSYANIYMGEEDNSTFLTLRTSRHNDHQTAGEIENQQKNLMHVSMRMYGRVVGDPGAVAGFFTFYDDSNESDIEILTRDPKDQTRYTNQPSVDKSGNEIAAASTGPTNLAPWDEWQTHRIDWLPKDSFWYLNDKQVAANTYSVPRKPSYLVLNMWGDGGEWSGNMTVGDHAEFQIQWIEMTFNTSGPYTGSQKADKRDVMEKRGRKTCGNVCKIDDVKQLGTPEIVSYGVDGEEDDGLSAGAKAGIAIGVILGVALLAAIAWFFWRKRRATSVTKSKEGYELTADQRR
ncbi:hypothetical protein HBI56_136450 [Parastagonospora nodorum]|uniref:Uncharacterized protein n=2 Tax=Phaeosphaeria nodorum (strain SN15 / ATCC MYA-4574 / FGSC 10173) TaxID=321614 RepID=Q0UNE9_PHANO|nr:hypothetical protein SNOG_06715 [Parastagonospora nodorum SN15]KAH3918660.1 hypothetical protein HBH56_039540 [Parastagonospora nodorum]EAT85366.1 hypothetical protein SNOG_06715 [Parastagonospora nodorum SN15]KAH3933912.1 hypothetical protein HBH54_059930 [Parastagonospora nodorum]KAH3941037.1 hypothetical protein HBH53_208360 [Parastagonospora nodorum]KAH3958047.1 hypothetical protein HBH51_216040 [Parastagonospora nodorum]